MRQQTGKEKKSVHGLRAESRLKKKERKTEGIAQNKEGDCRKTVLKKKGAVLGQEKKKRLIEQKKRKDPNLRRGEGKKKRGRIKE